MAEIEMDKAEDGPALPADGCDPLCLRDRLLIVRERKRCILPGSRP
ncbi:hypothetical protein [Cupriavidus pauculus]|nr:hypothetical protein [Cupriavidus pauculus]